MNNKDNNAVAIVGMSCHFPGANSLDAFWDMLGRGQCAIDHFTQAQAVSAGVCEDYFKNNHYVSSRGILHNLEPIDLSAIALTDDEENYLSLQTKLSLRLVNDALCDAGFSSATCPPKTAVLAGCNDGEWFDQPMNGSAQFTTMQGIKAFTLSKSMAGQIAFHFNCQAAAINVFTGCSTSGVAISQACGMLQREQAELAIVAAAALVYPQHLGYFYETGCTLSPDGSCRPFDARANGSVLSNGAGVLVLKSYSKALAHGDRIYSVIYGTAINNDGRQKMNFLSPGINGQLRCLKAALADAKVSLADLSYIEAHGTATAVGDPIEIYALKKLCTQAWVKGCAPWCGIGSVKSNIGHTTMASGIASVIKASLMISHNQRVPICGFDTLNPLIDLKNTPYYIAIDSAPLNEGGGRGMVGVSNFGFGGTNTHAIMGAPQ